MTFFKQLLLWLNRKEIKRLEIEIAQTEHQIEQLEKQTKGKG